MTALTMVKMKQDKYDLMVSKFDPPFSDYVTRLHAEGLKQILPQIGQLITHTKKLSKAILLLTVLFLAAAPLEEYVAAVY